MSLDQTKANEFAKELMELCQRHGVWIWGPTPNSIILSAADPVLSCTYEAEMVHLSQFLLHRKLGFEE